jgi:hypothetical protein
VRKRPTAAAQHMQPTQPQGTGLQYTLGGPIRLFLRRECTVTLQAECGSQAEANKAQAQACVCGTCVGISEEQTPILQGLPQWIRMAVAKQGNTQLQSGL